MPRRVPASCAAARESCALASSCHERSSLSSRSRAAEHSAATSASAVWAVAHVRRSNCRMACEAQVPIARDLRV
eukprot:6487050-Prymnesium_polylepis.1